MSTAETLFADIARLTHRIIDRSARVAVVGQGYVGLSLACAAADREFTLVGIDIDERRIAELRDGVLCVPGISDEVFQRSSSSGRMTFTTEFEVIDRADVVVICVPTPVRDHIPDLSYVEGACAAVAQRLTPGTLVVLESTTYPGTTEQLVRPLLEKSGLVAGRDFLLAYCPERIDPGNHDFEFSTIPRVVGGITEESGVVASLFYGGLVDKVETVSSCRAAELAKLLENTFRHVNIALVNELAMLCHETDVDVWEVIGAAATKPFGFMPFYPGPGVGGHCIPLDPTYLAWQVRRDVGQQFRILEQAQDINALMPGYVGSRISDALNEAGMTVKGTTVLVLGVAYKPDVGDVRESPALKVMNWLFRRGADVAFHDPYVESVVVNSRRVQRSELTERALAQAGLVAALTPHSAYDLMWIARHSPLVFDARNAYGEDRPANVIPL